MCESKVRASPGKWENFKESMSSESAGGFTYWKVLRKNKPNLDRCAIMGDKVIDTSEWASYPPDYDPELHWLVDQCIPQGQLGTGVGWITIQKKHTLSRKRGDQDCLGDEARESSKKRSRLDDSNGREQDTDSPPPSATTGESSVKEPRLQKRRLLEAHSSEEQAASLALESIADGAERELAAGAICSEDPNEKSGEYYNRAFVKYAVKHWPICKPEDARAYRNFPKVVAAFLLAHRLSRDQTRKFTDQWESLLKLNNYSVQQSIVHVMIDVVKKDPVSWDEVELGGRLKASQIDTLIASPFWANFLDECFEAKVEAVMADAKTANGLRLKIVVKLLGVRANDQRLLFGKTILGLLPGGEKVAYLMNPKLEKAWQQLADWCPDSELQHARLFCDPATKFKDVSAKRFLQISMLIASSENAIQRVVNAVAKECLNEFRSLNALPLTPALKPIPKHIYLELARSRLGVQESSESSDLDVLPQETDLAMDELTMDAFKAV